jgi:hypothetical protein
VFLRGLRDFVMKDRSTLWIVVRRPLALLFVCGCVVSIWTSGRFSARLIVDGMVSFAFIPVFQILSFAAAYRLAPRDTTSGAFAPAADQFFAGDRPWLIGLAGFAALRILLTPVQAGAAPWPVWSAAQAAIGLAILWSARVDYSFFRRRAGAGSRDALRSLIVQRAISWTCSLVYFFGIAIWPVIADRLF